jgi:hypothetical protein
MKNKSESIFTWGIAVSLIAASAFIIFGFIAWRWGSNELHKQQYPSLNDWGNYGSYLQGTVASLWALAGTFLIFAAFLAQKQQLLRQEVEIKNQEKQSELQQQSIKLQNFENSFFQLLNLHNQNVTQMQIVVERDFGSSPEYRGRECFKALHHILHNVYGTRTGEYETNVERVAEFYSKMFEVYQASLGHYFRTLYHVIKFVDESDTLKLGNAEAEKKNRRRYTSLARAQLSAFELELLFYNGISPYGEKFKPLIEKYGLLENFNTELLLSPAHESFYAQIALE